MGCERLTVEKLGADCIDVRMLNRARPFAGEAQRVRFGLRWPRLSAMFAYRYRLELRFGGDAYPQNVRVSWTQCHLRTGVVSSIGERVTASMPQHVRVRFKTKPGLNP